MFSTSIINTTFNMFVMPSALTVRLSDKVVHEVDIRAKKLRISLNEYIRSY